MLSTNLAEEKMFELTVNLGFIYPKPFFNSNT